MVEQVLRAVADVVAELRSARAGGNGDDGGGHGGPPGGPGPGGGRRGGADPTARTASMLRLSDAERDDVAAALADAHAEGRLDLDELSARLGTVYAARVEGDLAGVLADLPIGAHARFDRLGAGAAGHAAGAGRWAPAAGGRRPEPGAPGPATSRVGASTASGSAGSWTGGRWAARSWAEPSPTDPGSDADGSSDAPEVLTAILREVRRSGQWDVAPHLRVRVRGGSVVLELRAARVRSPVLDLDVQLTGGRVVVIVPDGVPVEVRDGLTVLGSRRVPVRRWPSAPNGPRAAERGGRGSEADLSWSGEQTRRRDGDAAGERGDGRGRGRWLGGAAGPPACRVVVRGQVLGGLLVVRSPTLRERWRGAEV